MRSAWVGSLFVLALFVGACSCDSGDSGDGDGTSGDGNAFDNAGPSRTFGGSGSDGNSGGSGDGNSGGSGDGDGFGPLGSGACAEGTASASRITPTVLLVVDGSCSMSTDYPSSGQSSTTCTNSQNSRWSALRNALLDVNTGVVTKLESVVNFGLLIYGTEPQCPLALPIIDPALNNAGVIAGAYPNAPPGTYTPTGEALDFAFNNTANTQEVLDQDLGPQIVILATDGEPNSCGDANTNYDPPIGAAHFGAGRGIKMHVISLASSGGEFQDHLQQLADIGAGNDQFANMATLFEPSTPEDLAATLELLIGGAIGCDLALNGRVQVGGECMGTVTLNGTPLACNGDPGWILTDPRHIRLQGSACDEFMNATDAMLNAKFPCSVFTPD